MKQLPDDGLIHRFIPALMGSRVHNRQGDARRAVEQWTRVLSYLHEVTGPAHISFNPAAREMFDQEETYKCWLSESVYESSPQLASHLGKHGGLLARTALTFHALCDPRSHVLTEQTMWLAVQYCRRVAKHAAAMFNGVLGTSPAIALAQSLGRSIVADGPLLTTVNRQWMSDHCTEFRKAEDRVKREAVQILEDADWLEQTAGARSYGGWPTKWHVHDRLSQMFAQQGTEWRARRAAVREAIGMEGVTDFIE